MNAGQARRYRQGEVEGSLNAIMERDDDKTMLRGTATRTSPASVRPDNWDGESQLPVGMHLGEFEIAGLIGKGGANVNARSNTDESALWTAAYHGHAQVVRTCGS